MFNIDLKQSETADEQTARERAQDRLKVEEYHRKHGPRNQRSAQNLPINAPAANTPAVDHTGAFNARQTVMSGDADPSAAPARSGYAVDPSAAPSSGPVTTRLVVPANPNAEAYADERAQAEREGRAPEHREGDVRRTEMDSSESKSAPSTPPKLPGDADRLGLPSASADTADLKAPQDDREAALKATREANDRDETKKDRPSKHR